MFLCVCVCVCECECGSVLVVNALHCDIVCHCLVSTPCSSNSPIISIFCARHVSVPCLPPAAVMLALGELAPACVVGLNPQSRPTASAIGRRRRYSGMYFSGQGAIIPPCSALSDMD